MTINSPAPPNIPVTLAYAEDEHVYYVELMVLVGTTVSEAIELSQVGHYFPKADFTSLSVGIFNQQVASNQVLAAGDRVEIYRPLLIDPKEARLKRAAKAKEKGAS